MRKSSFLRLYTTLLSFLPVLFLSQIVFGQTTQNLIRLHETTIQVEHNAAQWLKDYNGRPEKSPLQIIIRFSSLPDGEQQIALQQNSISLLQYLSGYDYTAVIYPSAKNDVPAPQVESIVEMKPEWKMDKYLVDGANNL